MVDGSGLENRPAERQRGFESHPLRFKIKSRQGLSLVLPPRQGFCTTGVTPVSWTGRQAPRHAPQTVHQRQTHPGQDAGRESIGIQKGRPFADDVRAGRNLHKAVEMADATPTTVSSENLVVLAISSTTATGATPATGATRSSRISGHHAHRSGLAKPMASPG